MKEKLTQLKKDIEESEFLLIGIGEEFEAGMKVLEQSNIYRRFLDKIQSDSLEERDFEWMYPAMLDYALTETEKQGSELQRIKLAYHNLVKCLDQKNYYIVTMNMDSLLQKIIGDDAKITAPFGSYHRIQCENGCDDSIESADNYNREIIDIILDTTRSLATAKQRVCAQCKSPIVHNTINSTTYLEKGYLDSWEKYQQWLLGVVNRKLCIVECGVSLNYPSVIRFPFEKIGFYTQKSKYYRINKIVPQLTPELSERGISIHENSVKVLSELE